MIRLLQFSNADLHHILEILLHRIQKLTANSTFTSKETIEWIMMITSRFSKSVECLETTVQPT
jgi:hypothetical protein